MIEDAATEVAAIVRLQDLVGVADAGVDPLRDHPRFQVLLEEYEVEE